MATSLARQFFEKAVAGGSAFLKNLVTEQQVEMEWLDFKGVSRMDNTQMSGNWSKFICGFANNEGGVLVWGIDARKDGRVEVLKEEGQASPEDPCRARRHSRSSKKLVPAS
jgi:predicted HTH transcriptional regulator